MKCLARTLKIITALALHQTARTLRDIAVDVFKPTDVYLPEGAPLTLITSSWYYRPNHLVIEDQEYPIHAFPNHVVALPHLGLTAVTTTDNGNDGSDDTMVYVLLNACNDPWALYGRDEEGYFLDGDLREVV